MDSTSGSTWWKPLSTVQVSRDEREKKAVQSERGAREATCASARPYSLRDEESRGGWGESVFGGARGNLRQRAAVLPAHVRRAGGMGGWERQGRD